MAAEPALRRRQDAAGLRTTLLRVLWAVFALLLPLTSFPLVKKLSGADMVAPAAGPVLLAILVLGLLPDLARGRPLPRAVLPLLAFLSAVLISCGLALFLPIPLFRDLGLLKSMLKALFTLAIGLGFYFGVAGWAGDEKRAAFLLRWINWGGLAIILWTVAQAAIWHFLHHYPTWMERIQGLVSTSNLYPARATAFAFEPSWLAHQLNMLYLPFWLAAAVCGTSVHRLRLGPLTFERLLLVGGVGALGLSVSRVGFLSLLFSILLLLGMGAFWLVGWLRARILPAGAGRVRPITNALLSAGLGLGMLAVGLGLFLGAALLLSRIDPRMKTMFDFSALLHDFSFARYANQLVFAERVIFWETGWNIFNDYPIFGVGLGNAGYFFAQKLSSFAWGLTEVRTLMYQWNTIPNTKSLWTRLLAETGIVGMAFFLSWLYVIWASARSLFQRSGLARAAGLAGFFVLLGLLSEGFSVDTFALPYFWVSFGIVSALAALPRRTEAQP